MYCHNFVLNSQAFLLWENLKEKLSSSISIKGPNATWHIDGYDKHKPYRFPIHGCIDGSSRTILWMKVGRSNNNPVITASYYMSALQEFGCCPSLVQTDCGTENGIIEGIQSTLMIDLNGHRYGSSPSNQRIESWWSHYRHAQGS
eukprot:gene8340-9238_t